ncbi:DUF3821 domain-containing protein [Methanoculleus frigidifontis]|nr:DUF3821 domain-containing protein [Methanoculleus sp. FWC-SCC1]
MKSYRITLSICCILLLVMGLLCAPAAARTVSAGSTIYVGEEGLDLTAIDPGIVRLVHYSDFTAGAADNMIDVPTANDFDLKAADVGGITGTYYAWSATGMIVPNAFILVKEPSATLDVVLNNSRSDSVDGKTVTRDTTLAFEIQNNVAGLYATPPIAFMNIEVTTPCGGTLTLFGGQNLYNIPIQTSTIYVGGISLADVDTGTYTAQAKWGHGTGLKGKGYDSNTVSFEVSADSLSLASSTGSVTPGQSFAVAVAGSPRTAYWLYVKDAGLTAESDYPLLAPGQPGVAPNVDLPAVEAANYTYTKAYVTTTADGSRMVQFNTGFATKNQTFTIKVVNPSDTSSYDEVQVQVGDDAVTTPTLDLASGWNFVSVPKRLADGNDNASAVFGDVDTAMHSIFRYDAATKLWSALDANSTIEPLNGYWVYANTSTAVDLIFASGGAATPPSKTLAAGWNAIGFSSTVPASAHDALFSVAAAWTNAIGWDADSQEYGLAIVNGGSGAYSDSRTMDPGQGYWLFMTEGGELAALTG